MSGGDEAAQRQALEIFDRLGAAPAAARLRRQMRAGGVARRAARPHRRDPRQCGGADAPAGAGVGVWSDEGLSNSEIARRLCISAKTAEHHVSAIMARLEAPTRQEAAAAAARSRGLLGDLKK